jgi:diguanylate cyclase (GGDEF)-like protein
MATEKQSDVTLGESCPRGPTDCPVFTQVEALRRERDRLADLAQVDQLTGLYNYRFLVAALEREMERTRRTGLPMALIMIDLDHFKGLNDAHGHQAGNQTLKLVSMLWLDAIRKLDVACRYGGEEFVIILPGTRKAQAVQVAERLRAAVEAIRLDSRGQTIRVTASFGVDVYEEHERLTVDELIERVDAKLLMAKNRGRNRVWSGEVVRTEVSGDERAALGFIRL